MAEQNVIQVVIESVNKMSQDLARIEGNMARLDATTSSTSRTFTTASRSSHGLMAAMTPLRVLLVQLTDTTGALGTAIFNVLRFGFNPWTLAVTGTVTVIAAFISKLVEARKAQEEFDKALRTGNISFFQAQVDLAQDKVNKLRLKIVEAMNAMQPAPQGSPFAAAQQAGLARLNKELEGPLKELAKAEEDLNKTRRTAALKDLPALVEQLEIQRKIVNATTEEEKVMLGIESKLATLRAKGLTKEDLTEIDKLMKGTAMDQIFREREKNLLEFLRRRDAELQRAEDQDQRERENALEDSLKRRSDDYLEYLKYIEKLTEEHNRKLDEELQKAEDQDARERERRAEDVFKITEQAEKEGREAAEAMAKSFADDLVGMMTGQQFKIEQVFANLGRVIIRRFLEEALKELLINPIVEQLKYTLLSGGKQKDGGWGIFDVFGSLFGGIMGLFGGGVPIVGGPGLEYGKGGVMSGHFTALGQLRKFQTGGVASGPTLGVIGEEGPEIVARMKPARPGRGMGEDLVQNIYLVDQRPPRLGPRDVVLYVSADMRAGGPAAEAVQNVIKRTK